MQFKAIFVAALISASPAWATFYCQVKEGGTELMEEPSAMSEALLALPCGTVVSLFDEDGDTKGAWVRVAFDNIDAGRWGAGLEGWVLRDRLEICG
ncbi:hypothetical protein AIOL_001558 [Candidatus Rhodobacter oscarellae]|uniref:SH3b domain-containing protein n=1 Tax=Candidatus Rhodobacter oscarellae TaxID=1675527 RepID=A0A0J9E431_9RHOB|nr:SH3 domain-containing protein [Candidatus Rhodobacter lobularis]KMW56604.1 hypothetical protein AIOL_001558 [Candidatus Rhodobacter lobularis]